MRLASQFNGARRSKIRGQPPSLIGLANTGNYGGTSWRTSDCGEVGYSITPTLEDG